MRMKVKITTLMVILSLLSSRALLLSADMSGPGRFVMNEPLGVNWQDEWITFDVAVKTDGKEISVGQLQLLQAGWQSFFGPCWSVHGSASSGKIGS